jgi:hypothetical protein
MSNVPPAQAERSMNVSFLITDAENPDQMKTNPPNANRTQCDELYKGKTGGGLPPYFFCDFMNVVSTALRGAANVDGPTLQAGVEGLGTSILGAGNYGSTQLGPGRYDGGTSIRIMEWDASIKDYRYVTDVLSVP